MNFKFFNNFVHNLKNNNWHENIFLFVNYSAWLLYICSILGIFSFGYNFFKISQQYIHIYIALFLIIKFNPYITTPKFTQFDKKIVFIAGLFILSTTIINKFIESYLKNKINIKL